MRLIDRFDMTESGSDQTAAFYPQIGKASAGSTLTTGRLNPPGLGVRKSVVSSARNARHVQGSTIESPRSARSPWKTDGEHGAPVSDEEAKRSKEVAAFGVCLAHIFEVALRCAARLWRSSRGMGE
jgi:hypothetical protein